MPKHKPPSDSKAERAYFLVVVECVDDADDVLRAMSNAIDDSRADVQVHAVPGDLHVHVKSVLDELGAA
jgi:hypothetical protein